MTSFIHRIKKDKTLIDTDNRDSSCRDQVKWVQVGHQKV